MKPSISGFYKNSGVAAQMFQQGSAWIAPWYHGRAKYMADRGVPLEYVIPKEGAAAYLSVIGVVKGTKNKVIAEKYINMVLLPEAQIAWATIIGAGPANKMVELEPAVAATVPYGDDQIKKLVKSIGLPFSRIRTSGSRLAARDFPRPDAAAAELAPAVSNPGADERRQEVRARLSRVDELVSLKVEQGEFVSCWARAVAARRRCCDLIAGYEQVDGGEILIRGRSTRGVPRNRRNVGMVA